MTQLTGPTFGPASGGAPKQLIVLLHGLGADGADLIDLAPMIAQVFPDALFVAPNAPQPCDMAPYGYQWFSLQDRTPSVMLSGARVALPLLNAYLDVLQKQYGIPDAQTALVGFSQGTMMGMHAALRRPHPLAAVVGFSGALLGADILASEIKNKTPICLIHGDRDMVVPYGAMAVAEDALTAASVPVEVHTRPGLGHGIDPEGIATAVQFLKTHLG